MSQNHQDEHSEFVGEYGQIKRDVRKVIVTNLLILVLLFVAFYVNQKTGFISNLGRFF